MGCFVEKVEIEDELTKGNEDEACLTLLISQSRSHTSYDFHFLV